MKTNIYQAKLLFKQKRYQETVDTCKKLLEIDDNSLIILKLISQSLLAVNQIAQARRYLQKALDIQPDDYEIIKDIGNTFLAERDLNTAKKYYQKSLSINNSYAPALTNLGNLSLDFGKKEEAFSFFKQATESDPLYAIAWEKLAKTYFQFQKLDYAENACREAISIDPNLFNSHFILAIILFEKEKYIDSEDYFRKTIVLNPTFAIAHFYLGNLLKTTGRFLSAESSYRKAISIDANYLNAYLNLGNMLRDLGKLDEAETITRTAIKIKPDFEITYFNLANILRDRGKLKESESLMRKAINLKPNFAAAYANLGGLLNDLDKLNDAEISTRKAIEIAPDFSEAHNNLGIILKDLGKFHEAEISIRKAIKIKPDYYDAFYNLCTIQLLQGDYQSGLINYEFRDKKKIPTSHHAQPIIRRTTEDHLPTGEKLLVITEQGLGDTLQYMRYVPYLKKQNFDISFCAQSKLHSLIKASDIDSDPLNVEQANIVSKGSWIPLLSIPKYLKVNPKNPIVTKPYINSTVELNNKWKNILSKEQKPIIAINWQGDPQTEKNYKGRSIPLQSFSTIVENNNISLLSLQRGFGMEQLDFCSFKSKFVKCQEEINCIWDFLENAAIIENCDLVITNDTSIAHLAGGMGKRVWLLLTNIPFWTWGLYGKSTFWYPSMRLFRQKEKNNWHEVMERVSIELQKLIR